MGGNLFEFHKWALVSADHDRNFVAVDQLTKDAHYLSMK